MPTKLIRSLHNAHAALQHGVVTIGNFDGVHLGHQRLVATLVSQARSLNAPSIVLTFEPHAFEFFSKNHVTIPRITRLREKFVALADCGVDNVLILPFNQKLADLSARDFINTLYQALKPQHFIIGDDFHFGRGREGDIHLLKSMGKTLGFSVASLDTVTLGDERISSTRVRQALVQGDLVTAARLLGHPYRMLGRVARGDQLGRILGFPTANLHLHRKLTPVKGVYTVYMHGITDHPLKGVANVGERPTVDGTRTLLEVHLLDFNQEIYGRYVKVEFCKKLRDEERYPNLELLKAQIAKDVIEARNYFENE